MTLPALRVEKLGKKYRLGLTHAGSLSEAASRLTRRLRGLPPVMPMVDSSADHVPQEKGSEFWALRDASFEVQTGEVVGIVGRNGAGKSTLLKILSRVTTPTEGRVVINGRVGSLLEVGTGFHPELTGRENIYMNGILLGMNRREVTAKLDEIVDFAGVEKFLDTPVKRYSSGMKVRLGFAVAAHLDPEVLIVDEVLAVGDAQFQRKCLGKMRHVAGDGRTVLFVSHNMGAIRSLCPRCVLLKAGTVTAFGNTRETIAAYLGADGALSARYESREKKRDAITEVRILQNGFETDQVHIDEEFEICIRTHSEPLSDRVVGVLISTLDGETICHLSNEFSGSTKHFDKVQCNKCRLPSYLLRPGKYLVTVWLGIRNEMHLDIVENCVGFSVIWTGRLAERTSEDDWKGLIGPGIGSWVVERQAFSTG